MATFQVKKPKRRPGAEFRVIFVSGWGAWNPYLETGNREQGSLLQTFGTKWAHWVKFSFLPHPARSICFSPTEKLKNLRGNLR